MRPVCALETPDISLILAKDIKRKCTQVNALNILILLLQIGGFNLILEQLI